MTSRQLAKQPAVNTIAVAGFGAIGQKVAERLDEGIEGLRLVAVSARNVDRVKNIVKDFRNPVPVLRVEELASVADIVIECAPAEIFMQIAEPTLTAGKKLIVISVGALLVHPEVKELARKHGGQIVVPTGALLGLDAVRAAAEGTINSVRMVSRKPPRGLENAPFLVERHIDVETLSKPLKLFEGNAREAVRGFPANLNVAAALSLAGIGPDRTIIEIWADPTITRNTHTITVAGDSADFSMTIENIPSENPKTGKITALSVIAALRKIGSPIQIGT
ncbi:MAG TPA: aspartate dehydrogenase [Pseudolabrys sp.]|nr:aspartate dehydrogenase [Pseudolabrys sp.]